MNKDLLYRFFSSDTSIAEEKAVLDWIDASEENRQEYLAERALFDAMVVNLSEQQFKKKSILSLPRWVRTSLRYAAIIAVAVLSVVTFYHFENIQEGYNTITVPAGQHIELCLADGTKVSLNASSTLRYPSSFHASNREVELTGEAFFDVTHNAKQPFIVKTFRCDVEVLGTKFDVEANPNSKEFSTILVEGSVKVSDRENPSQNVLLSPNQQVSLLDGKLVVDKAPHSDELLWRKGLIAFRDASFTYLLKEFEKYFGVEIQITCKEIPTNLFTGKIRVSDGLDHALWVLMQSSKFSYHYSETKDIIYIE